MDRRISASPIDAKQILARDAQAVIAFCGEALGRLSAAPPRLVEAIAYSLNAGGKRLRPALVMEAARAVGVGPESQRSMLAAAAAIELIHTFSLVHDDLPAMDNDDLRRGMPTNHKVFGEAMAILAGDAMVTVAFELIAAHADTAVVAPLVLELTRATGPEGMIGGQVLDMASEKTALDLPQLQRLHRMKTGALLTGACRLGAIAAGASQSQLANLTEFGRHLGLAFQIVDDILDVTASPEQLGKATQKDATLGKNTYPSLLGLQASQEQAMQHLELAEHALEGWSESADALVALARFVVRRDH